MRFWNYSSRSIPLDTDFETEETNDSEPEIRRTHTRKPSGTYGYRRPYSRDVCYKFFIFFKSCILV